MLVLFETGYVLYYMLVIVEKLRCMFVLLGAFGMLEMIEFGMIIQWMSCIFFHRYKLMFKNGGLSMINTTYRRSHMVRKLILGMLQIQTNGSLMYMLQLLRKLTCLVGWYPQKSYG